MAAAAPFSRLQLAAALLEYDNDPENPDVPYRSAQDSAIFSHMRRSAGRRGSGFDAASRRSTDYLGVTLPSEGGASPSLDPTGTRRSRASIDALQNPFVAEDVETDEEPEEEDMEVDLASWGLDTFMPKEKGSKSSKDKGKGKAKSPPLPNPHLEWDQGSTRVAHSRTMSMGEFGAGDAFLDSRSKIRRNSIANPLEMAGDELPRQDWRSSSHELIGQLPLKPPLHSALERDTIPFPTSEADPVIQMDDNLTQRERIISNGRLVTEDEPNPFAVQPPSPSRMSRFDPKAMHIRTASNATVLSRARSPNDENRDPGFRPQSQFDAQTIRSRHLSNASFGTRNMLLNDDGQSYMTGGAAFEPERRYSRLDLMRPKVLIMPSPLQSAPAPAPPPPSTIQRDGFLMSSDGPPLPPGARTSRSITALQPSTSLNVPVASNSFTANPRLSLSASQLLFRNTLMVGGQRDVAYVDIDGRLKRAQEDGEQVEQEWPEEVKPEVDTEVDAVVIPVEEDDKQRRPPGKLYGKSLIDDLEFRKTQIRSKQRVFTGDQRPSMMDRRVTRSSTLIDPASLQPRPQSQHMDSFNSAKSRQSLVRRGSRNSKPLLNFEDDPGVGELGPSTSVRGKSVFGVDTLWEREMAKLKQIEAVEAVEAEERRKREEEEEARKAKKKKVKSKGKDIMAESITQQEPEREPRISSALPPVLPDIPKTTVRKKKANPEPESDDESSSSEIAVHRTGAQRRDSGTQAWISDEEEGAPAGNTNRRQNVGRPPVPDDGSDEDLPLSVTLAKVTRKLSAPSRRQEDDSDDEDLPLSTLLDKAKPTLGSPVGSKLNINFDNLSLGNSLGNLAADEDDDEPLGIRASRIFPPSKSGESVQYEDEDDRPLAMHPEQQRRSQYHSMMAAAQQQQQQQMMFQAQMQNSMAFGPPTSMMNPSFSPFGAMQSPMMPMMVPTPAFSLPAQDSQKYGRVDRWRRDVAVEGEP
ncbi:hypothetical protein BD410DRAFT_779783 [Rickenella mellea]|uniref:Uncharacterized protein n=1 Tax=Rickenella mellea TaxID=50990 RepID=A0A4R5XFL2_9AGAM|nr:hypothetical protein BD410DRAFT_779783 [Rickenella mellea]